jgi:hypothetical protein
MVALVALAAFGVASSAMAGTGTASKHKGVKQAAKAAKHAAKKKSAKRARLLAATKSTTTKSATSPAAESTTEPAGETETAGETESAADTAAQDAACKAAGIDPNGNVQFDDQTNTCSLDTGGTDSQQQ